MRPLHQSCPPPNRNTSSAAASGVLVTAGEGPAPSTGRLPHRVPPTGDPELPLGNSRVPLPKVSRMLGWLGPHKECPGLTVSSSSLPRAPRCGSGCSPPNPPQAGP